MKQFIYGLVAAFCVTSVAQEVCRPPLVSFDVHRLELKNGYTHSTGGVARETRVIEVDYIDNRRIIGDFFESQGTVILTNVVNTDNLSRRIKYRHHVSVPRGEYTISQHDTDYEVCVDDGKVIFYTDVVLANGASHTRDWMYTIEIQRYGDFNNDGLVNGYDLGMLFAGWGSSEGDLNGDGITDAADLGILLENWRDD